MTTLTVRQLAQTWGVSPRTVRRACSSGFIPAERAAGCRGGQSGIVYRIPTSVVTAARPIPERQQQEAPIDLALFQSRGGLPATWVAADRRDLALRASEIIGPGRTEQLRRLAQSAGISLATLYRWMNTATTLEGAARTLRSKFDERGQRRRSSIEPEARDWFLAQWNDQKQLPVTAVIEHLYKPKAREMGWSIPSRATFYRLVNEDLSAVERKAGRLGIGALRRETLPKNTLAFPDTRNLVWTSDHRQFDAWSINPATGKPERPWLTMVMDVADRTLRGYTISFTPNSDAILRALHMAVYASDPLQPGLPVWFLEDNGQDYRSKQVTGALAELGIRQRQCEVESPWQKGSIESFFKLVALHFDRFMGWAGNNPMRRPELMDEKRWAEDGKFYPLEEFEVAFGRFVTWYHTEHSHTGDGMNGRTPLERSRELPAARVGVPSTGTWSLLTMKTERRRISDQGIKIFNRFFWHDQLYRHDNGVHRALVDEWVTVRFDPHDKSRIYVFYEGEFVCTAGDKPRPTFNPDDEANMETAGRVRTLNRKLERDTFARMRERAERAGVNPWIPSPDEPKTDALATAEPDQTVRMVTKMDRAAKRIEKQQRDDETQRKRDESVSAVLRERSNKFA